MIEETMFFRGFLNARHLLKLSSERVKPEDYCFLE